MGSANVSSGNFDVFHAVLWLPMADYHASFPVGALADLTAVAGHSLTAFASDINVHGKVIGTQDFVSGPATPGQQAFIWELDVYPTPGWAYPLGTFCDPALDDCSGAVSKGWGINDSFPGVVVGEASGPAPCLNEQGGTGVGFRRGVGAGAVLESLLPNGGADNDPVSIAFGIGVPEQAQQDPEIVGVSTTCGQFTTPCNGDEDAVHWQPVLNGSAGPDVSLIELPSDDGSAARGRAMDVNDDPVEGLGEPEMAGEIVGSCVVHKSENGGPLTCRREAARWAQAGAAPTNLHDIAGFPDADDSEAVAIANADTEGVVRIVGSNLSTNRAWKWERSGSAWSAAQLDTLISPLCGWERLIASGDVNDSGWIVGFGDQDQNPTAIRTRGYVLVPERCFADFNADGYADGGDLGDLLAAWGPCPDGIECTFCRLTTSCPWDLNCDGMVDGADVGQMLVWWGSCQPAGAGQQAAFAGGGGDLALALSAAGFSSVEAFISWAEGAPPNKVFNVGLLIVAITQSGGLP